MAVTDEIPGTTRDRLQSESDWRGVTFNVVDTGGIEVYEPKGSRNEAPLSEGSKDFVPQIRAQAMLAIEEADVIVMVVDLIHGITAADEEIAEILRRTSKSVIVAANKAEAGADITFLAHHGVIVCGENVPYAFDDLYYLERAAELTAVPDDELLEVYTALRPGRSTPAALAGWAARLDGYGAHRTAAFVREAAAVYAERGLVA